MQILQVRLPCYSKRIQSGIPNISHMIHRLYINYRHQQQASFSLAICKQLPLASVVPAILCKVGDSIQPAAD